MRDKCGNKVGVSIGELPQAGTLTGTEKMLLYQGGLTKRVYLGDIVTFIGTPAPGEPGPPGPPGPPGTSPTPAPGTGTGTGPVSGTAQLQEWVASTDGVQTATVSGIVTSVLFVTINGLIQPANSFTFETPDITYSASLAIMAGDVIGAYVFHS